MCLNISIIVLIILEITAQNIILSTYETKKDACEVINQQSTIIKCKFCTNIVDCLTDINDGITTFGLISPEDAILAAPFLNQTVVIAEIRDALRYKDKYQNEVVVLAKNFQSLHNSNVCYDDFKAHGWIKYSTTIFLDHICFDGESDDSFKHNSISQFCQNKMDQMLGPSCIPSSNLTNLCSECPDKSKCDYTSSNVLQCLQDGGNLAITDTHVTRSLGSPAYYCFDGQVSSNPCPWFSMPWPLLLANMNNIHATTTFLREMFDYKREEYNDIRPFVRAVVNPGVIDEIVPTNDEMYLQMYINLTHDVATKKLDLILRWCTTTVNETEKCHWIKRAVFYGGTNLNIECVQKSDPDECIHGLVRNNTDMTVMNRRFSLVDVRLLKSKSIETVAYTLNANPLKSLVVVKSKEVTSLKGKSGCFSGYEDEAFYSFFAQRSDYLDVYHKRLKTLNAIPKDCIKCNISICLIRPSDGSNTECALGCLGEGADFAVVSDHGNNKALLEGKQILCKDDVQTYSSNLHKDCYLSHIDDQILIRTDFPYKEDIQDTFRVMEKLERFKIFAPFYGASNVLFEDNCGGILNGKPEPKNYPLRIIELAVENQQLEMAGDPQEYWNSSILVIVVLCIVLSCLPGVVGIVFYLKNRNTNRAESSSSQGD